MKKKRERRRKRLKKQRERKRKKKKESVRDFVNGERKIKKQPKMKMESMSKHSYLILLTWLPMRRSVLKR